MPCAAVLAPVSEAMSVTSHPLGGIKSPLNIIAQPCSCASSTSNGGCDGDQLRCRISIVTLRHQLYAGLKKPTDQSTKTSLPCWQLTQPGSVSAPLGHDRFAEASCQTLGCSVAVRQNSIRHRYRPPCEDDVQSTHLQIECKLTLNTSPISA